MKDKRILLTKDIQDIYTKVVNTYLEKGYTIHIGSMSGMCSNEVSRIDVTNGKDIYRITLNSGYENDYKNGEYYYAKKTSLIVEKFENKADAVKLGSHSTIWSGHGNTICSKEWFGIGDDGKAWTDSIAYSKECYYKACERSVKRNPARNNYGVDVKEFNLSDATRAKLADICRKTKGYMRIKDSDIARFTVTTYGASGRKSYGVDFTPNSRKNRLLIGEIGRY